MASDQVETQNEALEPQNLLQNVPEDVPVYSIVPNPAAPAPAGYKWVASKVPGVLVAVKDYGPPIDFPGFSTYEDPTNCLCCQQTIVHSDQYQKVRFWGQWRVQLLNVILVHANALGPMLVYGLIIQRCMPVIASSIVGALLGILTLIVLYSYYKIIILGPGYFPFYYHLAKTNALPPTTDKTVNGVEYSNAGIITNSDQNLWACQNPKPNRSIMSKSAMRFVIRPDHFCTWTATWIGKRNHKFFMLFNWYGMILSLCHVLVSIACGITFLVMNYKDWKGYVTLVFAVYAGFNIWWMSGVYFSQFEQIEYGRTHWEIWNNISHTKFSSSKEENIADVYGGNSCCDIYCLGTPFTNLTNEEIVSQYANYYDETGQRVR